MGRPSQDSFDRGVLFIKAISIIGVVFHHITTRRFLNETLNILEGVETAFSWCVLAFICAAGWLHALSLERRPKTLGSFLTIRARRLMIPYVVLSVVYASFMQVVQWLGIASLRSSVPDGFLAKVFATLWPVGDARSAPQLYFLPLLFIISFGFHAIYCGGGKRGVACASMLAFVIGMVLFPDDTRNTGFNMSVITWGAFCYGAGFLMMGQNESRTMRWAVFLVGFSIIAMLLIDESLWAKFLPLILAAFIPVLRNMDVPLVPSVGMASGTIYVYHTPVILHPMIVAVAVLNTVEAQVIGALVSGAFSIAICCGIYFGLKGSRFNWILM